MLSIVSLALVAPAVFLTSLVIPFEGPVVRRFDPPQCVYCPGHRGVTIETMPGSEILAITDGVISFSGDVAGDQYVVQKIAPDIRVTYGWVNQIDESVIEGAPVKAGQLLAFSGGKTYLGVRIGEQYVEPLRFLGLGNVRLHSNADIAVGSQLHSR